MIEQHFLTCPTMSRGYHVITKMIVDAAGDLPTTGLLNVFIQHTSAALTINESADPDVLTDFEAIFNGLIPENLPYLTHTIEGSDDMPAHIKASLIGSSVSIPISDGKLNLGTWQGIYLCEFRDRARPRNLIITVYS